MKILFITPKIPYPPVDGHTKSMWGVIKYLSLRGHHIDIIAYKQNSDLEKLREEVNRFAKLHVLDVNTNNSVRLAINNLFSSVPYNMYKYERSELKIFIKAYLKEENPDIVQVVNSHMGWVVDFIRKYSKAPVVLREENFELTIMERYYQTQSNLLLKAYAYLQYRKMKSYEPSLCAKFDRSVMMSKEDEARLLQLNPKVKTTVIPIGVDTELLNYEKNINENYNIAHIGGLNWYPNLDGINWFLEKVFPIVLESFPTAKLFLYGGGSTDNLFKSIKQSENIIVKGFVEDIWRELKDKTVSIIPLRIGGGIRVKILELLATGNVIVSTSLGMEGLELHDGKQILIADSPQEFAEKIINLFNKKYDFSKISSEGKKFIKTNYLWEDIALKFDNLYKELLVEIK